MSDAEQLTDWITDVTQALDADLYAYIGDISREGYTEVCKTLRARTRPRPNAALFLTTMGGDAHAAFRIARAFGHHYTRLTLFVFDQCKSAGTLLAIGFNEVVIGDCGELGPLDVQLANTEELFEYNSGLDMMQAVTWLQRNAKHAYRDFLIDIHAGGGLSTRAAGEMASKLTEGMFSQMYGQLDPIRLGHVQRTMAIAEAYGERLNSRSHVLKSKEALSKLVYDYPSHDFVIDRKEATNELFAAVRKPTESETLLGAVLSDSCASLLGSVQFIPLSPMLSAANADTESDGSDDAPALSETPPEHGQEVVSIVRDIREDAQTDGLETGT